MLQPLIPRPGDTVSCLLTIPGSYRTDSTAAHPTDYPEILAGTKGRVVRLVHVRIEGEPMPDEFGPQGTIAHVLWEGQPKALPLDVSLLYVVSEAHEDDEVTMDGTSINADTTAIVESLKKTLSPRDMLFVVASLSRELARTSMANIPAAAVTKVSLDETGS